jgi:peptidyl-tRNA hydrolase, PTH1 family
MEQEEAPFLLVGLGNPGREYRETRHNVGFMAIDRIGKACGISMMKVQSKAIVGLGQIEGHRVILAKPQTFMNLSGQAVGGLMHFYKIPPAHFVVAHDDLDLPFGTLRIRPGGGSAGQKGMASIIQQLGTQDFARLRIGIGRPPGQMDPSAYVLENFLKGEQLTLDLMLDRVVAAAKTFIKAGLNQAMNEYNGALPEK